MTKRTAASVPSTHGGWASLARAAFTLSAALIPYDTRAELSLAVHGKAR
jgi:hypothetical protein